MTDLERRALLGDRQAQEECTEKGIMLPCPFCGGNAIRTSPPVNYSYRVACKACRANTGGCKTQTEADAAWNTRFTLPIGRCGECKHQGGNVSGNPNELCINMKPDDFCSYFELKEREEK